MTELAFAKTYLTTLDSKPSKYPANHVFDPATLELRYPYVLPKLAHPPHPEPPRAGDGASVAPGAEPASATLNITLKSSRNPNMTLTLTNTAPTVTIAALKEQIQTYLGGASVVKLDKIKVLQNKKPIPASKITISDIVDDIQASKELELGVMVMGGAPDPPPQENAINATEPATQSSEKDTAMDGVETQSKSEPVQPGEVSGEEVLQSPEFWNDLEGFLAQRIRSQAVATSLRRTFEAAWQSSSSKP